MANQRTDTQSVINLVINGRQAMTSLRELTDTQRRLNTEVRNMRPNDPGYDERLRELQMINRAMEEQRRILRGVEEESEKVKTTWKDIAAGILTVDVFKQVGGWVTDAIVKIRDAYQEMEKFRAILTVAFNGSKDLAESSLKMIQKFAADTPFAMNESIGAFIKLVNRGFKPVQAEMVKMGDIASSQGKSLDQYVEAMLDAQTGEFERLKEFGILAHKNGNTVELSFRGVTKEVENSDKAIRDALLSFGDMEGIKGSMEAVSKTVEGMRSNIEDTWDQIFTAIGKSSSGMINGFYKTYGKLLEWFKESFVDTKLSEEMEKERFELVKLEMQINSSNTSQEDRVKIIKKLKEEYPDYFKNINVEKLSTVELTKAFKKLNQEYLNKIILQKNNENLDKSEKERADTKIKQFEVQASILDYMARIKDKSPGLKLFGNNEIDQAKNLLMQLEANGDKAMKGVSRFAKNDLKNLLADYSFLDNKFLSQTSLTTKMMNDRQRMAKAMGMDPDADVNIKTVKDVPIPPTKKKTDDKDGETDKKKALDEFEKLDKEYKKLEIDRLDSQLTKNQKEVQQEARKYEELITKEQEFLKLKGVTAEQKKATEAKIESLRTDKKTAVNNLTLKHETELLDKVSELRRNSSKVQASEFDKQKIQINTFYDDLEKNNAGNEKALAELRIARQLDLSDAELSEKKRLEKEKKQIEDDYNTLSGDKDQNSLAKINKKYDDEIQALRDKFSEELQLTQEFQAAVDQINANRKAELFQNDRHQEKEKKDYIIQMAQQAADATFSIITNNQRAQLDRTLSSLESQKQVELSKKNLTEKEKEAINAKYDAKLKEAKIKGWKAEKAASVAQAVVNGALAITKVLAQTGILSPFAIPAIAAGTTLQIGVILAEPVPEFYTGVKNHKGGLAWVGDRGPEAVNENGNWWIAQTPTLVDLEKGADVYTASDTANMMKKKTLGEKIYQGTQYTVDDTAIRQSEMTYRNGGQTPVFSPTAQSSTAQAPTNQITNLDTGNMESKLDEVVKAIERGIIFSYSDFKSYESRIQQSVKNQQA